MNTNVNSQFLKIEKYRNKLASLKKYDILYSTYKSKLYPKGTNSSHFWNKKIANKKDLIESPIYNDKLNIVSNILKSCEGSWLDIGVGYGDLQKRLNSSYKLKKYGIDTSSFAVKNTKLKSNGNFKVGSVLKIPYNSSTFDYVTCLDVLEHIRSHKIFSAYEEIKRITKKSSLYIFSVPINEDLESLLNKGLNPNGHMRVYTDALINAELMLAGFVIKRTIKLFAFNKFYKVKKTLIKFIPFNTSQPNLCIIIANRI